MHHLLNAARDVPKLRRMGGETELEMVQRHVRRGIELVSQQRARVRHLAGTPEYDSALQLLEQLEMALDLHKQHLADLLRSG